MLGSTGSIGTQALEVLENQKDYFEVVALTAHSNIKLLAKQCEQFQPQYVAVSEPSQYAHLKKALTHLPIKVLAGADSICEIAAIEEVDMVIMAIVGFAALRPTITAIEYKKDVGLANKESLVAAGHLIMPLSEKYNVSILPIDSEHSAIFQCLESVRNTIEKIYLTASGGPFRQKSKKELENVKVKDALCHPTWNMGAKITIDSATMMNKGLEMIEARWLFDLKPAQIDVVIHPQSIIHSIVQFEDGSMKAQMGLPDMKLPIQVALSYPNRLTNSFSRFDFSQNSNLTFELPDTEKFPSLSLALYALKKGGSLPTAMNAANEVFVDCFLKGKISFLQITELTRKCVEQTQSIENPTLTELFEVDSVARESAQRMIH